MHFTGTHRQAVHSRVRQTATPVSRLLEMSVAASHGAQELLALRIVHMRPRFQNTTVTPDRLTFTFWALDRAIDLMSAGQEK